MDGRRRPTLPGPSNRRPLREGNTVKERREKEEPGRLTIEEIIKLLTGIASVVLAVAWALHQLEII
jgi:hypothetical protein